MLCYLSSYFFCLVNNDKAVLLIFKLEHKKNTYKKVFNHTYLKKATTYTDY